MLLKCKVTAFFVVSIFILTYICLLSSAIAACGIDTYDQLEDATAYLINILVACIYMQESQNLKTIQHNIPNELLTVESLLTN